jgi:hypothetical protein
MMSPVSLFSRSDAMRAPGLSPGSSTLTTSHASVRNPGGGLELVDLLLAVVLAGLDLLAVDVQVADVVARPLQQLLAGVDEEDVPEQATAGGGVDRRAGRRPQVERGRVGPPGRLARVVRGPPTLPGDRRGERPRVVGGVVLA